MKIAIGLNGSGKYLELTSQLYAEYNNLYDDVDFDFYDSFLSQTSLF